MNPKTNIFNVTQLSQLKKILAKFTAIFSVSASIAIFLYAVFWGKDYAQLIILVLAGVWATCAPFWFFLEFYYFYRKAPGEPHDSSWELFKHGQQLGAAVWAGFVVTLYGFGTSDLLAPASKEVICSIVIKKSAQVEEPIVVVKCPK